MHVQSMIRNWILFLSTSILSSASFAALGDKVPSLANTETETRKPIKIIKQQKVTASGQTVQWSVRERQAHGNTIREYISPDGLVFAVSWQGIKRPDLNELLGPYYNEFTSAEKKQNRLKGQRSQTLNSKRLVAHRSGHMRDIRGQVYLKNSLPDGMSDRDIE